MMALGLQTLIVLALHILIPVASGESSASVRFADASQALFPIVIGLNDVSKCPTDSGTCNMAGQVRMRPTLRIVESTQYF